MGKVVLFCEGLLALVLTVAADTLQDEQGYHTFQRHCYSACQPGSGPSGGQDTKIPVSRVTHVTGHSSWRPLSTVFRVGMPKRFYLVPQAAVNPLVATAMAVFVKAVDYV